MSHSHTATAATTLAARFREARRYTLDLAAPLSPEDQAIQSMADASPTKWHLAHTTWFFETFLLLPSLPGYAPFDADFGYLFNSYYESVGARHPRAERGLITRPGHDEVLAYRAYVDGAMDQLITTGQADAALLDLGLHHEQQHQELILMDIKHAFSRSPLSPAYRAERLIRVRAPADSWTRHDGGLVEIGHDDAGFAFDNEGPRHKSWLEPFAISDRLVTCGEWLAFMADGGYRDPRWWLSAGWATVQAEGWEAPLYWRRRDGAWRMFTLAGERPVDPAEPVCHVSFYEADAYARYAGRRLPTEQEWETAAQPHLDGGQDYFGQVWQWTASAYRPYPRYRPADDPTGEYNGKFMSGQMVLRGSARITSPGHARPTYRNFFPPDARWAFSGLRLADDV